MGEDNSVYGSCFPQNSTVCQGSHLKGLTPQSHAVLELIGFGEVTWSGVGVAGLHASQGPVLDLPKDLAGCWTSDRVASRCQETELSDVILGALSLAQRTWSWCL